jgi:hypothetical protein
MLPKALALVRPVFPNSAASCVPGLTAVWRSGAFLIPYHFMMQQCRLLALKLFPTMKLYNLRRPLHEDATP